VAAALKELEPFDARIRRGSGNVVMRARLALEGKPPAWGTSGP
jgi:hypothetical protein